MALALTLLVFLLLESGWKKELYGVTERWPVDQLGELRSYIAGIHGTRSGHQGRQTHCWPNSVSPADGQTPVELADLGPAKFAGMRSTGAVAIGSGVR
ncbi:hypothetical protein ASPBRDRAFT_44481 [Aspergillus brasiliensis CBS 101740]|uniref:Uncharacterized protein n=1 Tax=Aspergillus brasiliensis (strain CBS 101740 / IMI 381727 / IBT 21946) TaxID=767769 RepID=A0A1L9UF69_ASPBC|nr:hypothetical protein ASPBRDRAFT_44481 [Aspergillus brasiliensis CBS 101740]